MKLPIFNLNLFKRLPTSNTRSTTTFNKQRSTSRKSKGSSSSGRKSRKRSITYYSPSKSKLYPSEYFPSLQGFSPLQQQQQHTPMVNATVSTQIDTAKLNNIPVVHGHAKQTYLCGNEKDIILHQEPSTWLQQQNQQQHLPVEQRFCTNDHYEMNNNDILKSVGERKPVLNYDLSANIESVMVNQNSNNNSNNTNVCQCLRECVGVSSLAMPSTIPLNHSNANYLANSNLKHQTQQHQYQQQQQYPQQHQPFNSHQSNVIATYNSNINNVKGNHNGGKWFTNNNSLHNSDAINHILPFYVATKPVMKKIDRHRRKKVGFLNDSSF